MIEMQVMGIALDTRTGSPIVVLNDNENRKALPIWIGSAEASAIIRQMEKITAVRPMTHDLICNILEDIGFEVTKIEINDISSETYYANIFLSNKDGKEHIVDSRPSDAIAIALRTKSPIYVTAKVIADGTISTDQAKDKQEAEEFRQFIQDLKPSDFKKLSDNNEESNQ
ncbi:MAG: bifunctional nuclease family protein [Candidatus Gastranaerophilales bacterium]|nr:bifunctional nuclease family protein [Candidatus Gastranaerophilales bacterium]